jgi:hypothetical protein
MAEGLPYKAECHSVLKKLPSLWNLKVHHIHKHLPLYTILIESTPSHPVYSKSNVKAKRTRHPCLSQNILHFRFKQNNYSTDITIHITEVVLHMVLNQLLANFSDNGQQLEIYGISYHVHTRVCPQSGGVGIWLITLL